MIIEKKGNNSVAFGVETLNGNSYFLDVKHLEINSNFLEVPDTALQLIQSKDAVGKPVVGLSKIKNIPGVSSVCMYVDMTGSTITEISRDSDIGKTIVNARSGIII